MLLTSTILLSLTLTAAAAAPTVKVTVRDGDRRVDVTVDGQPFTSYLFGGGPLKKPVLWPLRTAKGTAVTRGFPVEPRPGERVDHPHHLGLWFNYGDVDGADFWNNSDAVKPDDAKKMGTVVHRKIAGARGGAGKGELTISADWVMPDGRVALREDARFVFTAQGERRAIDRIATLTAGKTAVKMDDNKEGLVAVRVARALEHPSKKAEVFVDASGKPTAVPRMDDTIVTGKYVSSEGKEGDAVWGTRARWVMLTGTLGDEPVTLAILDHPKNPGHPTYWHARGYGLFAANPLGASVFTNGKEKTAFSIPAGKSARFAYRVVLLPGHAAPADVQKAWSDFTREVR